MATHTKHGEQAVDDLIAEAIRREKQLQKFYERAIHDVGPDATLTMEYLYHQHDQRIRRLEEISTEILALRELTASIAD